MKIIIFAHMRLRNASREIDRKNFMQLIRAIVECIRVCILNYIDRCEKIKCICTVNWI